MYVSNHLDGGTQLLDKRNKPSPILVISDLVERSNCRCNYALGYVEVIGETREVHHHELGLLWGLW